MMNRQTNEVQQEQKSQDGFTLLEILVVLTIMGFLIAMVAPRLAGISGGAVDTVCDSNQNRMVTYMSGFYEQTNRFPSKLTNIVTQTATDKFQVPAISDDDADNGPEILCSELNDRNHFRIHYLNAGEAEEMVDMGIKFVLNLNDYTAYDDEKDPSAMGDVALASTIASDNRGAAMAKTKVAEKVAVMMVGCGSTTEADAWVATDVERGLGEAEWFGRIVLGMGPECGLITSGIIGNAAHCPGGIQNADNCTYNDYNLVLPRLSATSDRMTSEDSFGTAFKDLANAKALKCVQYDETPKVGYKVIDNEDKLKYRVVDITEVQETWQFATQCPEGHAYPEDDGEFWGADIDGDGALDVEVVPEP